VDGAVSHKRQNAPMPLCRVHQCSKRNFQQEKCS